MKKYSSEINTNFFKRITSLFKWSNTHWYVLGGIAIGKNMKKYLRI